jgi:hypothetical protein
MKRSTIKTVTAILFLLVAIYFLFLDEIRFKRNTYSSQEIQSGNAGLIDFTNYAPWPSIVTSSKISNKSEYAYLSFCNRCDDRLTLADLTLKPQYRMDCKISNLDLHRIFSGVDFYQEKIVNKTKNPSFVTYFTDGANYIYIDHRIVYIDGISYHADHELLDLMTSLSCVDPISQD